MVCDYLAIRDSLDLVSALPSPSPQPSPRAERGEGARRRSGSASPSGQRSLLLDSVMNLPEPHRALGGFGGELAVILAGALQRRLRDRLLERPVAQDRFDGRPVQAG